MYVSTKKPSKKPTYAALLLALGILTACEATEGLGRDTEKLGQNIRDAAQEKDGNRMDDLD